MPTEITNQDIKTMLAELKLSKGFRNLPNNFQAVIKVSVIARNERVIFHIRRLLEQEKQGLDFNREVVRLLVDEVLNRDQAKHIIEYKEAVSKKQDETFLGKLLEQFDEEFSKD
jgi:hypothetical protein